MVSLSFYHERRMFHYVNPSLYSLTSTVMHTMQYCPHSFEGFTEIIKDDPSSAVDCSGTFFAVEFKHVCHVGLRSVPVQAAQERSHFPLAHSAQPLTSQRALEKLSNLWYKKNNPCVSVRRTCVTTRGGERETGKEIERDRGRDIYDAFDRSDAAKN